FLPSFWYAAPFQALFIEGWQMPYVLMTLLALLLSSLVFFVGLKRLDQIEAGLAKTDGLVKAMGKGSWLEKRATKLFCRSDQAKANFKFIYRMTGKSHDFQMKIMPAIGMSLILPFVF